MSLLLWCCPLSARCRDVLARNGHLFDQHLRLSTRVAVCHLLSTLSRWRLCRRHSVSSSGYSVPRLPSIDCEVAEQLCTVAEQLCVNLVPSLNSSVLLFVLYRSVSSSVDSVVWFACSVAHIGARILLRCVTQARRQSYVSVVCLVVSLTRACCRLVRVASSSR